MLVAVNTGKSRMVFEAESVIRIGNDFTIHRFNGCVVKVEGLSKTEADSAEDHFYGLPSTISFAQAKHSTVTFIGVSQDGLTISC